QHQAPRPTPTGQIHQNPGHLDATHQHGSLAQLRRPGPPGPHGRMVVLPSKDRMNTLILALLCAAAVSALGKAQDYVVAYCAQDEDFALPILRDFERET